MASLRGILESIGVQGKLQLAERLLQMHASVDAVDKRGRTALMSASGSGREEEVGLLLHYKASVPT